MLDPGAAADEAAGLEMVARRRAALVQEPLQAGQVLARRARFLGQGHRLLAGVLDDDVGMIAEIGADARQVALHRDAQPAQQIGRADAGELQQLRAVDRAAAQDDLALRRRGATLAANRIGNAGGALALDQDLERQGAGDDGEIGPRARRIEIAARGAPAPALVGGAVTGAEAFLLRAVAIGRVGIARLLAGFDEGLAQNAGAAVRRRHAQRAVLAVIGVGARWLFSARRK